MAYKELTLTQAAKFDHENGLKYKLTGWGIVSKNRREMKISRKARRQAKQAQERN